MHVKTSTFAALALVVLISLTSAPRASAVSASPNSSGTNVVTQVDGNASGFSITADVEYDPDFGPWVKELKNTGGGIASGADVPLSETLTNSGSLTWTDWHEAVVSTTVAGGGTTIPGFLFRSDSLVVKRNGVTLVEGLDYTLAATVHTASGGGNFGNWEAVSILFSASGQITPGQILTIEKQLFEVFLDGDPWRPDDVATIEQYPTVPEPSSWGMLAVGLLLAMRGRRRSR